MDNETKIKTYLVYVNRNKSGSIKTHDIENFVKTNYPGMNHSIDHKKKKLYLRIGLFEAVAFGSVTFFDQLSAEESKITNKIYPQLDKQMTEAVNAGDLEKVKETLRQRKQWTQRHGEVVQMMEQLAR